MLDAFKMFARYNRIANECLYQQCAQLNDSEYRLERKGSFGSIHKLLNHMLLGDQIWMARFAGGGKTTPPLNTILFETFPELRKARTEQDEAIEAFFTTADDAFLSRPLHYINSRGIAYTDSAPKAVLHFFNHQTHHRGQVHVMLSQTEVKPPSLDMHRILNP
ncbi:MAG: DinB family protein [Acidobacteriaceae bacterium]